MATIKLITDAKALTKEIGLISTAGKKLDARLHVAMCSAIHQAMQHNNADPAMSIVNGIIAASPRSARTNSIRTWFLRFGQFKWNAKKKQLTYDKNGTNDIEGAMAMPFWELDPEPTFKVYDVKKAVQSIITKAEKILADEEQAELHEVSEEQVVELKKMLAHMG